MNAGLLLLALRRTCAPAVVLAWAGLLALSLASGWSGDRALLEAAAGSEADAVAAGMVRAGVFGILSLTVVPLLVVRAARTVPAWRAGEGEWIGSRPVGRASVLASTWAGTFLGALLLLGLAAAAVETRVGREGVGLRLDRRIDLPGRTWIEPGSPLVWTIADPGGSAVPGSRARVRVGYGPGSGSVAEVELRARRVGSEAPGSAARERIGARGAIEVELPPGSGALELALASTAPGSRILAVGASAELWIPCASPRSASAEILARLGASIACWTALAIGLGAWMSVPSASAAVLAAWLPAWLAARPPAWLPGADIVSALAVAGEGRVPEAMDPSSLGTAAAIAIAGLLAGAAGLSRWRDGA